VLFISGVFKDAFGCLNYVASNDIMMNGLEVVVADLSCFLNNRKEICVRTNLKLGPPEYKSGVLTTVPRRLVETQ
jgi:hypothetical protein